MDANILQNDETMDAKRPEPLLAKTPQTGPNGSLRVLVAEDDESVLDSLCALLEEAGWIVEKARASEDVLLRVDQAHFECRHFDALLADYKMPGNENMEMLPLVHERYPNLPIIIMTGYPSLRSAVTSLQNQAYDYLTKPLDIEYLFKRLREAAELHRLRRELSSSQYALQASEAKYRRIVETTEEGIWEIDAHGHTTFANAKMAEMLDCDLEELGRSSLFDFMDEEWRSVAETMMERRQRGIREQHEFMFRRKDGRELWTLVSTSPQMGENGEFLGSLGMIIDISQRKAAEQAYEKLSRRLQQIQKVESLERLAGGMAHHFNNLLQIILGNTEIALDEAPLLSPLRTSLEEIDHAGRKAAELSLAMLDSSGHGAFELRSIPLSDLFHQTQTILNARKPEGIELKFHADEGISDLVGDHRQIRQLIGNLVENAWESMERKKVGVVTVEASTRHCDTEYLDQFVLGRDLKPGPYIQISVSDHGCGMNAEVLERLYDPFYSTREVGRGLGLPAVLGIVRAHKGAIRVYSEPGEGTTVNVMFPAQANSSERGRLMDDPKRAEWNGKGTALLVDDDELVLKLGRRMLTQLGVETVVALSGDEAVRVLKANPDKFDCAIIDRTMPEMNGEILFDKIRSLAPSLPVIISSGHSEHDIRSRFARRRIAGFIQKPYQLAQLRVVLARVLGD